jgi:transcriptional regulator with XRE-family HTH domain
VKEETLNPLLEKMGKKLRELRLKKGYKSHETFAFDFELPRMHYWRIENGKTNLTFKTLLKILKVHKISFEEFVVQLYKQEKKVRVLKKKYERPKISFVTDQGVSLNKVSR